MAFKLAEHRGRRLYDDQDPGYSRLRLLTESSLKSFVNSASDPHASSLEMGLRTKSANLEFVAL